MKYNELYTKMKWPSPNSIMLQVIETIYFKIGASCFESLETCLNYGGMNLEMEKNVNFNIIWMFALKNQWIWTMKMDFISTFFWFSVVCIYPLMNSKFAIFGPP